MTTSKQSPNVTHRKRLARRLAQVTNLTYAQALARVVAAAEAGLLPTPLEPAGMDTAVRLLVEMGTFPIVSESRPAGHDEDDQIGCVYCHEPLRYAPERDMWVRMGDDPAAIFEAARSGENPFELVGCPRELRTGGLVAFLAAGCNLLRFLDTRFGASDSPDAQVCAEALQSLRDLAAQGSLDKETLRQWAMQVQEVGNTVGVWGENHGYDDLVGFASSLVQEFSEPLLSDYDQALSAPAADVDNVAANLYGTVRNYGHIPARKWLLDAFGVHIAAEPVTADLLAEAGSKVHKARPNEVGTHCAVCRQPVKRVPGGQGPTWVHSDTGFVVASGGDPEHPLSEQAEDTLVEDRKAVPSFVGFAHEGNPVPRCSATSWRGGSGARAGEGYGPGGFNRCVKRARHESERHIDEWGNVFELDPKFRVIKNVTQGEVARVAAKDGIVLIDLAGNPVDPALLDEIYPYQATSPDDLVEEVRARLAPNLLVQTKNNEVLKVSEIEKDSVTAQVVYPVPPRTSVRRYSYVEAANWREPSDVMVGKYERAWGFAE